jgi:hypothetical protein
MQNSTQCRVAIILCCQINSQKNAVFWDVSRVALVGTDVSAKLNASFIRVTRIVELGITLAVTSNRRTLRRNVALMNEALISAETSVPTRATRLTSQKTQFF